MRGIVHNTAFPVRSSAGRSIFQIVAMSVAVRLCYLCGISGGMPFSDIPLFGFQDSRKAVLIACLFHAAIIFRGFGSANSLAVRVFIFAARDAQIGLS